MWSVRWLWRMPKIEWLKKLDSALKESVEKSEKEVVAAKKKEIDTVMKQAQSTLIMNLCRQYVGIKKTTMEIWSKLDQIYMAKSTAIKIFLKEKFYGFKMNATVSLEQNLDDLNITILALINMRKPLKFGTLTLEDVTSTLRSRNAN
ncbi:hypothetical protein F8388_017231 [Cannabis sativa]|uniref:Uncharacterized protein n=1 Tax=Cannabis sativa TaxID=3483 RepID=A0A7J6FWK6_CANSA|nr:hypothetical protein F8388_017231 [Cannabis sativa]